MREGNVGTTAKASKNRGEEKLSAKTLEAKSGVSSAKPQAAEQGHPVAIAPAAKAQASVERVSSNVTAPAQPVTGEPKSQDPGGASAAPLPPMLFEIAWEVCWQLGGIYTVLRSKADCMIDRWDDRYCLIGPYNPATAALEFEERPTEGVIRETLDRLRGSGDSVSFRALADSRSAARDPARLPGAVSVAGSRQVSHVEGSRDFLPAE